MPDLNCRYYTVQVGLQLQLAKASEEINFPSLNNSDPELRGPRSDPSERKKQPFGDL